MDCTIDYDGKLPDFKADVAEELTFYLLGGVIAI